MNPYSQSEVKSSKHLSIETSLLGDSMLNSMSLAGVDPAVESQLIQKTDGSNSNGRATCIFSNSEDASEVKVVDGFNLNRDTMPPWTIVVTRAELVGHGEVPMVESTNMGPVMHFSLSFFDGKSAVHVDIATKQSVMHDKPKLDYRIQPEPQRIKVGAWGHSLAFEHDFDRGAMYLFGEEVLALFVEGGKSEDQYTSDLVGPMMIAVFKDRPEMVKYPVEYVHLECKPVVTKSKYFQVF